MSVSNAPLPGLLLTLLLAASGCQSDDDDKTVAGRTRSLASADGGDATAAEPRATLRFVRNVEQVTGVEETRFEAALAAPGALEGLLRLPGGAEERLEAAPDGGLRLARSVTFDPRFGAGAYTFLWALPGAGTRTLSLLVEEAYPPTPRIVAPTDLALEPAGGLTVAWEWEGSAGLFDVVLADPTSGERVFVARDVAERTYRVPPGVLVAARRYRLEVRAVSGPDERAVRHASGASVLLDTAP